MKNQKRYAVVIDTYVYAENDYMARQMAHSIKRDMDGDHSRVIEIFECPFANLQTRKLKNITEPTKKIEGLFTQMGMNEVELPF
jgi:hypothetical protein|tara:strand:+ start:298 stop:549 length:252 start_codon:yes stop_codon:yes gene_type:complete